LGYAKRLNDDDRKALKKDSKDDKNKAGQRVPSIVINWSKDSKKFAVVRRDERKVGDLWVVNHLSNPRPTLETYRYAMPGEPNIAQPQIEIFDVASKGRVKVKAERFKDQGLQIPEARPSAVAREKEHTESRWVSDTSDKLYFTRSSRDLHKFDLAVADTTTGEAKTLVEERLNVYIETRPVRLINGGQELLWWSDGPTTTCTTRTATSNGRSPQVSTCPTTSFRSTKRRERWSSPRSGARAERIRTTSTRIASGSTAAPRSF
jgi:hypothetical protein